MNILITALGTMSATYIARELRNLPNTTIFGADINQREYIYASRIVDSFHTFPGCVNNPGYLNFIIDFCKKNTIDFVFPIIDEEVELLTQNSDSFKNIGTTVVTSGQKTVETCRNKLTTTSFVAEIAPEICLKATKLSHFNNQFSLPVFVKPTSGRASIDCRKITSQEELTILKNKSGFLSELMVQELAQGEVISVDLIRCNATGKTKSAIRREVIRNGNGCATAVEFIENSKLTSICHKIASEMETDGVINFEFFKTQNEDYKLIEINPRFPAGTEFTCKAGLNLVKEALEIKKGNDLNDANAIIGKKFVRNFEIYETE